MQRDPSTISGVTFSQAKRIAKSEFGDEMIKIDKNITSHTYDVYVNETAIEKKAIEKFKRCWSNIFRIIPIEVKKFM